MSKNQKYQKMPQQSDQMIQLEQFQNGKPLREGPPIYDYSKLKQQITKSYLKQENEEPKIPVQYPETSTKPPQNKYIVPNKYEKPQNINYSQPNKNIKSPVSTAVKKYPQDVPKGNNNAYRQSIQAQRSSVNKRSSIPEVMVACDHCTSQQNVPGNTQVYICCCCENLNECIALYGLFVCGKCRCKVCYPYWTSQMIRCTQCSTVNKVPTQPKKRYVSELQQQKRIQSQKKEKPNYDFANEYFSKEENIPSDNKREKIEPESMQFDQIPYPVDNSASEKIEKQKLEEVNHKNQPNYLQ